ncbi:hypothetical protein DMUE_2358 [Dictyocoela muelleri]|nr:hypothetical protein DMUE_2358 [Dictyocoela muelleri]
MLSSITNKLALSVAITVEEFLIKISIINSIIWTERALDSITSETILNCFSKIIYNCTASKDDSSLKNNTLSLVTSTDQDHEPPTYQVLLQNKILPIIEYIISSHINYEDNVDKIEYS